MPAPRRRRPAPARRTSAPNLFLVYVTDLPRATRFYSELFDIQPQLVTPRYVPFQIAPGVLFAIWPGRADAVTRARASSG